VLWCGAAAAYFAGWNSDIGCNGHNELVSNLSAKEKYVCTTYFSVSDVGSQQ
jgi:hypothetical protein